MIVLMTIQLYNYPRIYARTYPPGYRILQLPIFSCSDLHSSLPSHTGKRTRLYFCVLYSYKNCSHSAHKNTNMFFKRCISCSRWVQIWMKQLLICKMRKSGENQKIDIWRVNWYNSYDISLYFLFFNPNNGKERFT